MLGIGEIIRINRIEKGYSQEALCFGICAVSSLSKIENGSQIPTRGTFEALMERLGLPPGIYPSFLNDRDKNAYELQHDFNELYANGNFDKAKLILNELKEISDLDKVYKEFVMLSEVLIKQQEGLPPIDAIREFEEIIDMFFQDFTPQKIRRLLLTKTEINLLNAYAAAHYMAGNADTAKEILYEIITYIDSKVYDREGITIVYTQILSSLSNYVGLAGKDEEAIRLCDIGIKLCIRYNRFTHFSHLLFNKGYGLINLGKKEEGAKFIQESYYIDRAMGERYAKEMEITRKFAKKHGIELL